MKIFKLTLLATAAIFVGVTGFVPGIVLQDVQAQEVKLKAASFLPGKVIFAKFFFTATFVTIFVHRFLCMIFECRFLLRF